MHIEFWPDGFLPSQPIICLFPNGASLNSSSPQAPREDMQIIAAFFVGSVIREGSGKIDGRVDVGCKI
jgi:hypothetical protein